MERSVSGLAYKGSITEAIVEAKKQKKLFVVYLSGEDADSAELEKSTWSDLKVAESVTKYCILLHVKEGSPDAVNFSAIYPQNSVPSIAAIGYNGVQVWQNGGFVSAEVLSSSLEKAWLSLHIQETTATVLSAALASKKYEPSTSESPGIASSEHGNSMDTVAPSPSMDKQIQSSEAERPDVSEMVKANNIDGDLVEENDSRLDGKKALESSNSDKLDGKTVSESSNSGKLEGVGGESSTLPTEEAIVLPRNLMADPDYPVTDNLASGTEIGSRSQEKNVDDCSGFTGDDSQSVTKGISEAVQEEKAELADDSKPNNLNNNIRQNTSSDVHFNIRLPDGVSLQEKFVLTSNLRMVKDYVDGNQASSIGSYDLAIPYPRKVFSDEDLSKSLSELGLFNRQALIVVPRQRATSYHRGDSSSSGQTASRTDTDSSNANGSGYFSHIRRILSFINPLSYLGGGASSQSQTGMWEYDANPALQNNLARTGRPSSNPSPNESGYTTGRNDSRSRQDTSRFGSNIHTLKHDEDDRFNDRNSFWNGNSTQYGGNDDRK